ncbi:MAG: hypothetical protein IKJ65_00250 [Clostridia bacterium]|nr:hypothetical protein [Clostridia bacterium]
MKKRMLIILAAVILIIAAVLVIVFVSADKPKEEKKAAEQTFTVGSVVTFGRYEQDANTENGMEPIEWHVIREDGTKRLLLSRYALDAKAFNDKKTSIWWETCTLRTWLNGEFMNTAFSEKEQSQICKSLLENKGNERYNVEGCADTEDYVFLLSLEELETYVVPKYGHQAKPTPYAIANGAYTNSSGICWWWLRTIGSSYLHTAVSNYGKRILYEGNSSHFASGSVRPAIWLDLAEK